MALWATCLLQRSWQSQTQVGTRWPPIRTNNGTLPSMFTTSWLEICGCCHWIVLTYFFHACGRKSLLLKFGPAHVSSRVTTGNKVIDIIRFENLTQEVTLRTNDAKSCGPSSNCIWKTYTLDGGGIRIFVSSLRPFWFSCRDYLQWISRYPFAYGAYLMSGVASRLTQLRLGNGQMSRCLPSICPLHPAFRRRRYSRYYLNISFRRRAPWLRPVMQNGGNCGTMRRRCWAFFRWQPSAVRITGGPLRATCDGREAGFMRIQRRWARMRWDGWT